MSSASSAVTYTSVYTDSEPGRAFWGADDEEISEGGIPRVIVLGYDGLPMQPVAPPSPDYIPGPEDPQTPPVPQDEDEREPMFVQAHDPDYVPEPIYPEYIPLEDEHEFPAEEQPLPPVDSPTAESPGYVTESDPEEDPEEYEDDETEDGPVIYLTLTRPDISYSVHSHSQYMHALLQSHIDLGLRVLKYPKGAPGSTTNYEKSEYMSLKVYADSDWAKCHVTRRSISGYCVFLNGCMVSWKSKKQATLSKSYAKAEYSAAFRLLQTQ
ncbi:reverse transcriptase domain-containing protein [Tanacetum coccineum]